MDEQSLFAELVDLPDAAARAARLAAAADGNTALRERMERLLARHAAAGSFLEHPVTPAFEPDASGTTIGPYKLLELIGEGGMGAVYMAEQTEPVRRRVAVKVIKPGMDSRAVIARFEAERQALALMDHPNIARVFDGGQVGERGESSPRLSNDSNRGDDSPRSPGGRPYFVMELVRGLPITDYCDGAKLPIRERLTLFVQVCRAVQHAHTKGIIHRDLKPSNVLVTVIDGVPVPKVIDFGVAKATGGALTDRTLFTGFHQLVGTPLYMAPEQAEMSGVDVDTRADVYALGVLLYELLTGTTPFDPEVLRTAGFDEMRRMIREDEPVRPSQRVNTLAADKSSTVADRRGVDPRRLGRLMQSELDWVVMRALDKDRNRRYETAGAFAADIERYLADAPVEACPPSVRYRLRKFVGRNKAALAMATALSCAVLAVAGSLGWALRDAAARRIGAEQAAAAAMAESTEHHRADRPEAAMASAVRAVDTLTGVNGADGLLVAARQQIADLRMVSRLEDLWFDAIDVIPYVTPDTTIAAYHAAFQDYGIDPVALTEAEAAERVQQSLIAAELVAGLDTWAWDRQQLGGPSDPLAAKFRAIADAADPDPWSRRVRDVFLDVAPEPLIALAAQMPVETTPPAAVRRLGSALSRVGRRAEAESLLRRATRLRPASVRLNYAMGQLLNRSPSHSTRREALEFFRAALAGRPRSAMIRNSIGAAFTDRLHQPEEGVEWFREALRLNPDYMIARMNLSVALGKLDKYAEAVDAARQAVAAMPNVWTYVNLADRLGQLGRQAEAGEALRAALRFEARTADEHLQRGQALNRLGRFDEAVAAFRESNRLDESCQAYSWLGMALSNLEKMDEAIAAHRKAIQWDPSRGKSHHALGITLRRRGKVEDAIRAFREGIRLEPAEANFHVDLGHALSYANRPDEAAAAYREGIRLRPGLSQPYYSLGVVLGRLERWDEAEASYRKAIEVAPDYAEAHCNLGNLLTKNGQFAEALTLFQRGHELGSKNPNWRYPSDRWVENAQRLVRLEVRLPAILAGTDEPADPADAAAVAVVALERKNYARAAELYRSAILADPVAAGDVKVGRRYWGAVTAVRFVRADEAGAAKLDNAARSAWRRQALDWLRADLTTWQKLAASKNRADRSDVRAELAKWQREPDLEGVRSASEVAKLPADERAEWESFWADVRDALEKARADLGKPK